MLAKNVLLRMVKAGYMVHKEIGSQTQRSDITSGFLDGLETVLQDKGVEFNHAIGAYFVRETLCRILATSADSEILLQIAAIHEDN